MDALLRITLAAILAVQVPNSYGTNVQHSAHGWDPVYNEYPWVVAVYRLNESNQFSHICGGSLISEDKVLSAAHCFWNGGQDIPIHEYRITTGNTYRDFYKDERLKEIHELQAVTIHERYRDRHGNYAHDIAIVWLQNKATFNPSAFPIGIDWNNEFEDINLEGQSGIVVGWGYTETDCPSTQRKAVNLAYREFGKCWKTVPLTFRSLVTPDKFCAGHRNGTAVCPGDSGGAWACQDPNTKVWYLRGIVSVGVQTKNYAKCHPSQYSVFTSIANNYLWLKRHLNMRI